MTTPLTLADRVRETTTSTGIGAVALAGAPDDPNGNATYRTFVAAAGDGAVVPYAIVHRAADEWEVGEGTVADASPDTLSRDTVLAGSNGTSAVNLSAGTKDVLLAGNARVDRLGGWNVASRSGAFTAATAKTLYLCTVGSSYTATLPAAAGNAGLIVAFKIASLTGSSVLTIDAAGSETIDGDASLDMFVAGDFVELQCDAAGWHNVAPSGLQPHRATIRRAAAQSIVNAAWDELEFDTSDLDVGGLVTLSTGSGVPGKFTLRRAGHYLVTVSGSLESRNNGKTLIWTYKIGSTRQADAGNQAVSTNNPRPAIADLCVAAAGDVVVAECYQDSGAGLNTKTGSRQLQPKMSIVEVRP